MKKKLLESKRSIDDYSENLYLVGNTVIKGDKLEDFDKYIKLKKELSKSNITFKKHTIDILKRGNMNPVTIIKGLKTSKDFLKALEFLSYDVDIKEVNPYTFGGKEIFEKIKKVDDRDIKYQELKFISKNNWNKDRTYYNGEDSYIVYIDKDYTDSLYTDKRHVIVTPTKKIQKELTYLMQNFI